jgi:hypothetical protein
MKNRTGRRALALLAAVGLLPIPAAAEVQTTLPASPPGVSQGWAGVESVGRTPPRLSFISGDVSFWRPGAEEWAPARVNTALAPGDHLYAGQGANLELQIDGRAFVRAAGGTQLGIGNQDSGFLQLTVTGGLVALDLRELPAGYSIEIGTPAAALTVDQAGYYVTEAQPAATLFTVERGGRATITVPGGVTHIVGSGQRAIVRDEGRATVETTLAPPPSDWDRWNWARSDALLAAQSAQYVPLTMYGASDLDRYGSWRTEAEYGPVWIPSTQPADWVPYSAGRWMWDPYYGWTWVDDAPWGWAPYHYGRWVFLDRVWAWVPGPFIVRPAYSPALVAFFGFGGVVVAGGPIGWIALGWGEPLIPWWGPVGFIGRPCWIGWGGPRIVNNVVIHKTTIVNVTDVKVYRNTRVHNAVVAVSPEHFGNRHVPGVRVARVDLSEMKSVAAVPVKPTPASFVGATGPAVRPPERLAKQPVVTRRALPDVSAPDSDTSRRREPRIGASEPPPAGPGVRRDGVTRSSRSPRGEPMPPAARPVEPRGASPRTPLATPPPPPVKMPGERQPAWRSDRLGADQPARTRPEGLRDVPDRGGMKEGPGAPIAREAPGRVGAPPQGRTPASGDASGIVMPSGRDRDVRARGQSVAPPGRQPRFDRRIDGPRAPRQDPGGPPADSGPKPGAFHPGVPQGSAPGSPRTQWNRRLQVTEPVDRARSGNRADGPPLSGGQGRQGGDGDRAPRGTR